jgi:Sulfite reductase, beta subunit (hemoprotein)
MVVYNTGEKNAVNKSFGHRRHEIPPDRENEDQVIGLLNALNIIEYVRINWFVIYLPRKFKIAITGAPNDRAAIRFHGYRPSGRR